MTPVTALPRLRRPGPSALVAIVAGLALALAAVIAARPAAAASSLPTTVPSDAKAAKLTVTTKTVSKFNPSGQGFNGVQTLVFTPPKGRSILQGFATTTGGNTGSMIIRSTQVVGARAYVVRLLFPGSQGTPGVLHVQLQLVPRS
jgi:hypothetical protein